MADFENLGIIKQLIVSATYIPSDIELSREEDAPLMVNYYARNNFTWTQTLSDSSRGVPPTGGVWVPILSGDLVLPSTPHAYLSNRHFPTYASVPYIGNLYTVEDSGGYFIPKMLGVSTFLSRKRRSKLDTLNNINLIPQERGKEVIFQNPSLYTTDQGLSKTDQLVPVSTIETDSSWIKDNIPEHARAGMINAARWHQEFSPYQTKYESANFQEYGIRRQGDEYDPWTGSFDTSWNNEIDFPPNFREQHNILEWYNQFRVTNKQIYNWKTDIYGNEYSLFKDMDGLSVYDKRKTLGEIWTRDARNIVKPASSSLENVYDKFVDESNNFLISNNIYDIDIWYDVMMVWTPSLVAFAKLDFSFDTNIIFTVADNIHKLWLCNNWFAGTWFEEQEKFVTVGTLGSALHEDRIYFYPILREYNLENNSFTVVYTGSGDTNCKQLTSMALSTIEDPVFTFNPKTNIYNMAFIGSAFITSATPYCGMNFVSIDVKKSGDTFDLYGIRATIPTYNCLSSSSSS